MRCERCWSEEGVAPVAAEGGDEVLLCAPCRRSAPEDPLLFRRLFLRFASRKELLRHFGTRDDEEALRRWAEETGLSPETAVRRVGRERNDMGLLGPLRRRARRAATAPYGYRYADDRLVPFPFEADVVRRIFRMGRDRPLASIADALNAEGVPTRRGRRWHPSTVRFLLRNPLYAGYVRRAGFVKRGDHPPLVDVRTFREVQEALVRRRRRPPDGAGSPASV